ncbi:MAG TPA: S8 family serine peptidase, partial [Candidatus Nitrosopolaris sp.]|nr:S8 family serine peptidase [Candidatus Nitrosopolaris sp.]
GSVDNFEPAGIEGVIAVGAIDPSGQIASFSNHGNALSVGAPGVDVLSTRSSVSPVDQFGARVGQSYLRLSGTSMASPHAAGLSALVLSGLPGLTPEEVRWQLELNATQPGFVGYPGPWNPYFGWGRIDASHVLDPVPVTTRFRTHQIDLHGFVAETRPSAATADFLFTTSGTVPWSLASPSWLVPDSTSGNTAAKVSMTLDTTGLPVGSVAGSVDLSAPSAVDGGGSIPATLQVHGDQRVGGEILVVQDFGYLVSGPRVIQSSLGSLVFWSGQQGLQSARIDDAGTVTGPFQLAAYYPSAYSISVAGDGQNVLLAWVTWTQVDIGRRFANYYDVKVMRIGATGEPLGPAVTIESKKLPPQRGLYNVRIGYDGSAYTVLWGDLNYVTDRSKIYALRVAQNGLPQGRKQRIYPARGGAVPQFVEPEIACVTGECLVAWDEFDGETSSVGKYIYKVAGVRLAGGTVMDAPPLHLLRDADFLVRVATDGSGYLVLAERINLCQGPVLCGEDVIAARMAGGTSLDPNGIRLNTNVAPSNYVAPSDVSFDGTNWVVPFLAVTSPEGTPVLSFIARLSPSGTVVDSESPGLLLSSIGSAGPAAITDTGTSSIAVWPDSRFDDLSDGFIDYRSLFAQRILTHP